MKPQALPATVRKILTTEKNICVVSAVSFWEISLKFALGKLDLQGILPSQLRDICEEQGYMLIDITCHEAAGYHGLTAAYHKDPFDKMLIWQAIQNDYTLLSVDKNVKKYETIGLKVIG
jgi:PIN domain nuclease of toxin-antitoxin system